MVKVRLTKRINRVKTKIYPSNKTLLKGKQSNETHLKGYASSTDFISRVKTGLCFPICFHKYKGIGKVKMSNDTKFKVKQING